MKISEMAKFPNGEASIKYSNDYFFYGLVDENDNPVSGTIKAPDGSKYFFGDLRGKDILNIINLIKNGKCEIYKVTEDE